MDIRFEVKDRNGEIHAWKLSTNRMGCTLERFMGISEGEKSKGEERWGKASFPSSIVSACRSIMHEGMRIFPGEIKEIVETTIRLQQEILEQLRPLAGRTETVKAFDLAMMRIDEDLKVKTLESTESEEDDGDEEDDGGFSLEE